MAKASAVNINPDAVRQALIDSGYAATVASEIIGGNRNYISAMVSAGRMDEKKLKSLAALVKVKPETLLAKAEKEQPPEPPTMHQNGAGTLEQVIRVGSRLDDIEKELRRLQAMEMRQEKLVNQISAMVEMMVKWTDVFDQTRRKAIGCETNLLRLLALLEGKKKV